MKEMTRKQREVYDFICTKISGQGFPPTVREIGCNFEISVKGAYDHLKAIERKGFIRCSSSKSRAIEIMDRLDRVPVSGNGMVCVPLMGRTTAGMPVLAEENIEAQFMLPRSLIGDSELFALRVEGDSMVNAGIHDGDLALIKMQAAAEDGDIVLALLDDETTIKRFFHEGDRIRLQPENDRYQPFYVRDAEVLGKVVWVFRKIS